MVELKKLGRYELRSVLGKGAMGVVYEGYDPTLSRRVAVKTILKSVAFDDETERNYAERFVREAKAVARLNHANIVQVHDFGVENEVAYLVMEFIQGRELRSHFLAAERFEIAECVRIMCELLDALDFAHEAGVIHRDIKPANVMLDAQRRVKLADFGVARVQDSERSAAGTMVGTPAFMSPEQISGKKIDRRTDIFSAGTILYQLLTGEQPFKGDGAWTVAKQIMQDEPPRPSSIMLSLAPAFDEVVNKALAKSPGDRFPSAKQFAAALRAALALAPGPQPEASVERRQQPRGEIKASETELEFWRSIQNRDDLDELELYVAQFPEGAYTQLARLKIAKLKEPAEAARKAAEEKARQKSEAQEKARQEAEEQAERQAAEEKARQEAEELARREALEKTQREAAEKARKETEEKVRQAQALARLRQQEEAAARARAAVDEDATVAIGSARPAAAPAASAERKSSYALPAVATAVVVIAGIGAFLYFGRTPAPAPAAQAPAPPKAEIPAPAPPKAELSAADIEKIRKETEERIRREYADKSAAEQAKAAKAAADKAVQEKQLAAKAAAEKVAQEKLLAMKAAAEKAAAEKAAAEKVTAERAVADRAAAEKAARVAAEKAAEEKAAATRAAEEKAAAAKTAEEKAAAAAKAPPVTAAVAPAPAARGSVQPGSYMFRVLAGGGVGSDCDRIGFQEDIEVRAGQSISGREFNGMRFQDGSISATVMSIQGGRGAMSAKLSGRTTATGYAGSYEWGGGNRHCTGQWTLVRKGESAAEAAAAPAKAPAVSVASTAPAAPPREAGLAGRYAFRVSPGGGIMQECDRIDIQDDIEISTNTSKGVSGQGFAELKFQSAPDGAVAGTAFGGRSRFGAGEFKFLGRVNSTGYAGDYSWRPSMGAGTCTGRWTLVRK